MQNLVQNADQIKTGLETDLNNAQQASKDLKQNTAASVTKIETAGQTQIDLIKQNGGGVENALSRSEDSQIILHSGETERYSQQKFINGRPPQALWA